jgi:hypothetical protein
MGYDADRAVLTEAGVNLDVLDSGCCGLAGNFGFEAGHYDVSPQPDRPAPPTAADYARLAGLAAAGPGVATLLARRRKRG